MADINTLWPNSFSTQIIWSCCSTLDSYTQHSTINIVNTTNFSVIFHSDIKCPAITVGKGNNLIFYIFNILSPEFSRFVFYKHKVSSN